PALGLLVDNSQLTPVLAVHPHPPPLNPTSLTQAAHPYHPPSRHPVNTPQCLRCTTCSLAFALPLNQQVHEFFAPVFLLCTLFINTGIISRLSIPTVP